MEQVRKAFIMLSAAVTVSALAAEGAQAGELPVAAGKAPPKKGEVKKKKQKRAKKRVKRVKRARKRPADFDRDLGMPAGTLYDVIGRQDL